MLSVGFAWPLGTELLLNVCWAVLTLLGACLWWHGPLRLSGARSCQGLRAVGLVVCVMALLFPVISITDDLHVGQPAIEESKAGRRAKQLLAQNASGPLGTHDSFPAQPVWSWALFPSDAPCGQIVQAFFRLPNQIQLRKPSARAPPVSAIIPA
jgi:hypothetical protein